MLNLHWTGLERVSRHAILATAGVSACIGYLQPYRLLVFNGDSMEPTYANFSVVVTEPFDRPLELGDVVVLDSPKGMLVKRVAFLPGDTIRQYWSGSEWADLVLGERPSIKDAYRMRFVTVPKDHLYVLGDNREESCDSRELGMFTFDQVKRILVNPQPRQAPEKVRGERPPMINAQVSS